MVLLGTLFAIIFGTLTGVISAWRRGTSTGMTLGTALALYSMPTHWLGLMLIILFAGTLPTGGMSDEFLVDPTFFQPLRISRATSSCPRSLSGSCSSASTR